MPYAKNKKSVENTGLKQRKYVKFDALDREVVVVEADMWLQNGKYDNPGISIAIDGKHTLSDWTRKIKLENVCLEVVENDKGYPELVISGIDADTSF